MKYLRCEGRMYNEASSSDDFSLSLSGNDLSDKSFLPEALYILLNEKCMDEWRRVSESNNFASIISFADEMKRIGDGYSIKDLIQYGEDLRFYAENFDIENMDVMLKSFPNIVSAFGKGM